MIIEYLFNVEPSKDTHHSIQENSRTSCSRGIITLHLSLMLIVLPIIRAINGKSQITPSQLILGVFLVRTGRTAHGIGRSKVAIHARIHILLCKSRDGGVKRSIVLGIWNNSCEFQTLSHGGPFRRVFGRRRVDELL